MLPESAKWLIIQRENLAISLGVTPGKQLLGYRATINENRFYSVVSDHLA